MIELSTKGRYATRLLVHLAGHPLGTVVRRQDMADAEAISVDYVEQLLIKLKGAGLVRSHRGARGGYSLATDPHSITVADVLRVMEGPFELVPCVRQDCSRQDRCRTRSIWREAAAALITVFSAHTIGAIATGSTDGDLHTLDPNGDSA
ncbi:MAG: RrF2 family transcriptional regulator [Planctomycetota bacterium]